MKGETKLLSAFATPIVVHQLSDPDPLNRELAQLIRARREQDPGVVRSNRGGWHSSIDLLSWTGKPGAELVRQAVRCANTHSVAASKPEAKLIWGIEAWANINRSGDHNNPHVHGGAFWSVVYYVQMGEGSPGRLMLHDPRLPALRMHAPWLRFRNIGPEFIVPIEPRPGMLVLFPAWLSHSVAPWEGKGERISIAMNLISRGHDAMASLADTPLVPNRKDP